jgi:hypothetical protein
VTKRIILGFLLGFVMAVSPFLSGYWSGLTVNSTTYTGPITTSKEIVVNLSGTSYHSLMWSMNAGAVITVQLGVKTTGGMIWATPTNVGPFTVVAGTPQIEPLFIPVAEQIKITVTGTATGTISFIAS